MWSPSESEPLWAVVGGEWERLSCLGGCFSLLLHIQAFGPFSQRGHVSKTWKGLVLYSNLVKLAFSDVGFSMWVILGNFLASVGDFLKYYCFSMFIFSHGCQNTSIGCRVCGECGEGGESRNKQRVISNFFNHSLHGHLLKSHKSNEMTAWMFWSPWCQLADFSNELTSCFGIFQRQLWFNLNYLEVIISLVDDQGLCFLSISFLGTCFFGPF